VIDSIKNLIKPVLKTRWFLHFPYLCAEVKLHSSFRDEEFHYFTLDLCTGVCPAVWSALERLISTGSSLWPGRVVDFSPQRGMWRESCQVGRALYLPIIFILMFMDFPDLPMFLVKCWILRHYLAQIIEVARSWMASTAIWCPLGTGKLSQIFLVNANRK
jgi:hypothetical protein